MLPYGGDVCREGAAPLLVGLGRGIGHESRQRDLRIDDDLFLFGEVQHDVGPQVAPLLVLDVVLRLVMDPLGEGRVVEDRFEQHLAPVALHLRIALQRLREVLRLGRDVAVELHQGLQLAPLRGLRGVDLLDALAEVCDVVAEGFEHEVDRLAACLPEMLRLLAEDLRREVLELGAEALLGCFALGLVCGRLLGILPAQGLDLRRGRGPQRRQFGLGAQMLFADALQLRLCCLAGLAALCLEYLCRCKMLTSRSERLFQKQLVVLQAGYLPAHGDNDDSEARDQQEKQQYNRDDKKNVRIHENKISDLFRKDFHESEIILYICLWQSVRAAYME